MNAADSALPPPPADYAHRMPPVAEAQRLESVGPDVFGRELRLTPEAAGVWRAMRDAAAADGVKLLPISGFRSVAYQTDIVRRKLDAAATLAEVLRFSAYPGHSEHHAGTALDLGSPEAEHLSEAFEFTREFAWLVRRAAEFGFALSYPKGGRSGVAYEPWHWNYSR